MVLRNKVFQRYHLYGDYCQCKSYNHYDYYLLEMVNAGLLPMVVVDSHKAMFWKEIFDKILVHNEIAVRRGGQIAWAFRYESPKLKEMVDAFVGRHKKGTLFGNVILKRYLKDNKWVRNNLAGEH